MISVDDIAALCTIADRNAPFSHRLKRRFVDLHWILDHDKDGMTAPSRVLGDAVSPQRHAAAVARSPSRNRSTTPAAAYQHEQQQHPSGVDATSPCASQSGDASSSRPLQPAAAWDQPPGGVWRSLPDVDTKRCADDPDMKKDTALINSPRSALVILRNGFGVADILAVPAQQIRNQALLDGSQAEAVEMRLAADANRRQLRREMLAKEYADMCREAPRADVVEAMRDHFFAALRESKQNLELARCLDPLVPISSEDCAMFDQDCIAAIHHARERAAKELTRHLAQQQRQRVAVLQAEEEMLGQQRANAGQAASSNYHRDRIIAAKRAALREYQEEAMDKSVKLVGAQRAKEENRAAEIVQRRRETEQRAEQSRKLSRIATSIGFESLLERREKVREVEREMIETRRDEIEAKARFKDMLHQRNVEVKEAALAQRRQELEAAAQQRREKLQQQAEAEHRRRETTRETIEAQMQRRAEEIVVAREARLETKKQRAKLKAEKLAAAKAARDQQLRARLQELDQSHEQKLRQLELAEMERRRAITVQNEKMALVRQERAEEQARAQAVDEFKYVGYVAANQHKSEWLEREVERRGKLALAIRQEREAIARARDDMKHDLVADEATQRRRLEMEFK